MQIIYNSGLSGNMFKSDPGEVLNILKELTIGIDSETFIRG